MDKVSHSDISRYKFHPWSELCHATRDILKRNVIHCRYIEFRNRTLTARSFISWINRKFAAISNMFCLHRNSKSINFTFIFAHFSQIVFQLSVPPCKCVGELLVNNIRERERKKRQYRSHTALESCSLTALVVPSTTTTSRVAPPRRSMNVGRRMLLTSIAPCTHSHRARRLSKSGMLRSMAWVFFFLQWCEFVCDVIRAVFFVELVQSTLCSSHCFAGDLDVRHEEREFSTTIMWGLRGNGWFCVSRTRTSASIYLRRWKWRSLVPDG